MAALNTPLPLLEDQSQRMLDASNSLWCHWTTKDGCKHTCGLHDDPDHLQHVRNVRIALHR